MHLIQDYFYDEFIRKIIDCSDKYNDKFIYNGKSIDGTTVRKYVADIEEDGFCILAKEIYDKCGVVTVDLRGKDFDYIVSAYREQSQKVLSYRQIDTINLVMLVDIDVLDSFLIGEVVDKINKIDLHHNFDKIVFCAVCMTSAYRVLTYDSWKAKYELSDMVYLD